MTLKSYICGNKKYSCEGVDNVLSLLNVTKEELHEEIEKLKNKLDDVSFMLEATNKQLCQEKREKSRLQEEFDTYRENSKSWFLPGLRTTF